MAISQTHCVMAQFSSFLGKRVQIQYQAGGRLVPATGVLVADSGRSVFLEEHFARQNGAKQFRWEIPYQCIGLIEHDAPLVDAVATPAGFSSALATD